MNDARETDEKQPASSAETPVAKKSWIKLDPKKAKRMMSATVQFVGRMGAGAAGLLGRLKKDASPEAMLATLSAAAEANRARREETSARLDERQAAIVRLKKAYESASPVRKRILQAELKTALAHYKATEREVGTLLENEQVLAQAVGRIHEMAAYDMAGVSEDALDDLAVDIDSRVDDAEARLDAARDLEKAGRRRNRESDAEDLWEQLAEFDEQATPETDDFERELAGFEDDAGDRESAREAPPKKAAPPRPETEG